MDTSDWRDELLPETRQLNFNEIMDTLQTLHSFSDEDGLLELQKIAQSVEEKTYAGATGLADYLQKIDSKILLMETSMDSTAQTEQPSGGDWQEDVYQKQPNPLQRDMQQRLQASGSLLQQQSVLDQQKQLYQSQRPLPETSSTSLDSTAQSEQPSGGDWQEEVYQKIKTMKENYLPELNEVYQKIATKLQQHDSRPQQPKSDQLEKLKVFKTMLERMITFLQVSKSNILPNFKDKLGSYEKQIINFINTNRPRKATSTLQPGQLPLPHMHSMSQPQSQVTQVQSHENQMNTQLQISNGPNLES